MPFQSSVKDLVLEVEKTFAIVSRIRFLGGEISDRFSLPLENDNSLTMMRSAKENVHVPTRTFKSLAE
jgi:hypothetical protein